MHAARISRRGFTLVELLVVIAIVAILAALVTAGVMKIMSVGPQVQTTNEIRQLALAVENFKQKYGVYPPSSFDVPPTGANLNYARRIWPRVSNFATLTWPTTGSLQGDQCLVFFLQGPAKNGWSANPADPTATGGTRIGPFYEFPDNRLFVRAGNFNSFADANALPTNATKNRPYLYFVAYPDGYHSGEAITVGGVTVSPYYVNGSAPPRFFNRNSFQIISAGENFAFGSGGAWAPGAGSDYGNETAPGFDDLSNFHANKLGVP